MTNDPYLRTEGAVQAPPGGLLAKIRHLGPGFILSAAIVGSGELIATTTLGARAGFITFWVILVSCLVKVTIQIEFGRHAILTGETAMEAFHRLPGPIWGKGRWTIWTVLLVMLIKLLQVGGIIGGVAIILQLLMPALSAPIWAIPTAIVASLLVYRGYYRFIERLSLVMIAFFTLFTFASLYFLAFTPYAISADEIWSGLQFQLPREAVAVAIGAFGITGVGADEIIYYNYWCLEKGYAAYTGPVSDTAAWRQRARGWMRVMYLDALLAMVLYTLVTAAFYLLGAAVLHARGGIPEGYAMVETLSEMYTRTLGPGARWVFLAGAFVVLFSTLFAALAAWTRLVADLFGRLGWINFHDPAQRRRAIALLAWILPLLWALLFAFIQLPVLMVISGGIVGSFLLFLVVYAALYFRYRRLHPAFLPGRLYDTALWLSALAILLVGVYGLVRIL